MRMKLPNYRWRCFFTFLFCLFFNGLTVASDVSLRVTDNLCELQFVDREDIVEVVFADGCGIVEIPDYAFLGCSRLRKVVLPNGIKKIGFQAFCGCSSLESVVFPSSLEDIGSNAFVNCSALDSVSFPDGLKHIGHNAFSFCVSLRDVWLPDSLREIESYAFSDCDSLLSARLPANSSMLGELIFNCCQALELLIEPSADVPPFDCGSFIFDPIDSAAYERCILKVPAASLTHYRNSPSWNLFKAIQPIK